MKSTEHASVLASLGDMHLQAHWWPNLGGIFTCMYGTGALELKLNLWNL